MYTSNGSPHLRLPFLLSRHHWVCLGISIQSLRTTGLLLTGFPLLAVVFVLSATRLNTLLRRTCLIVLSLVAPHTMRDGMILTIGCALLVLALL